MNKKRFILLLTLVIFGISLIVWQRDSLNQNSGFIQMILSFILVIITGVYAYFNYQMVQVMAKQTIADIKIGSKKLKSSCQNLDKPITENSYLEFKLYFDVFNKGVGCGSIEKPFLILKFKDNFEYKIKPKTKDSYSEKIDDNGTMQTYRTIVNDLGGTLYLRGGEYQKVELEYQLWDMDKDLIENVNKPNNSVEYLIEFKDNLNKKYLKKIEKID